MNLPKLRFKDFSENWCRESVNNLVKTVGGATPSKDNKEYWNEGDIPWVSSQEVAGKYITNTTYRITGKAVHETSVKTVPKGTILMVTRSGILKHSLPISILTKEMAINQDIKALLPDNKITTDFLYHWLKRNEDVLLTKTVKGGTTVQSVNMPDFQKQDISFPEKQEQKAISLFFNQIDRRIELQQSIVKVLREQKKGLLQKIFSREIQFKDEKGEAYPEWELTTFNSIADIRRGASPRPISDSKWFDENGEVGWLRISDVSDSKVFVERTSQYLSHAGIKKSVLLEEEHLIMSIAATIGKPIINKIPVCIHDGFITFKNLRANKVFVYYFLEFYQEKWLRFKQPGTQFNLNSDLVGNLEVHFPQILEQKRIADFLIKFENKIWLEEKKLSILLQQKKGLMQQMFI